MDEPFPRSCSVRAWRPPVPGIAEVFHARMVDFAYPPHTHDTWTLLIVDTGAIRYHLDRRDCGVSGSAVSILPPGVIHDGRPDDRAYAGFRKRNLYLEASFLPQRLIGSAVDRTTITDPGLRRGLARLHDLLSGDGTAAENEPSSALAVETGLALVGERVAGHLDAVAPRVPSRPAEPLIAFALRDLLDAAPAAGVSLAACAQTLDRSVPHLVRSFTRAFGISPHAYVIARRIGRARALLLTGSPPATVAVECGFHDQAHFTRHFKRHTSFTPGAYASSRD